MEGVPHYVRQLSMERKFYSRCLTVHSSVFTRDMVTNRWKFSHNVEGFSNLIKSFEVDPTGNIWANMYKRYLSSSLE